MHRCELTPTTILTLTHGDITAFEGDAIVNAANETLLGGGGVDGAIHRAAGPDLLGACYEIPEVRAGVRCPTGEARITPGFRLSARFVIHAVGPRWSQPGAPELLAQAWRSALMLARQHQLRVVAFPAISTGAFGCPMEAGAEIAIRTCQEHAEGLDEIVVVLYDGAAQKIWVEAAERLVG